MMPVLLKRLLIVQTVEDVRQTVRLKVVMRFEYWLLRQIVLR